MMSGMWRSYLPQRPLAWQLCKDFNIQPSKGIQNKPDACKIWTAGQARVEIILQEKLRFVERDILLISFMKLSLSTLSFKLRVFIFPSFYDQDNDQFIAEYFISAEHLQAFLQVWCHHVMSAI